MKKLENEVLLSRRAALGAFATVAMGTAGLLAGCGSDKATVTEDAGDGDKKEEAKKEEQSMTDLAVGATVTTAAGLSVVVDSVQPGLTNYDGSTMTGIHVTYVNNGDEGADYTWFAGMAGSGGKPTRLPSLASFFAIADGLGITPEELIAAMRKEAEVREKSNGERAENDE